MYTPILELTFSFSIGYKSILYLKRFSFGPRCERVYDKRNNNQSDVGFKYIMFEWFNSLCYLRPISLFVGNIIIFTAKYDGKYHSYMEPTFIYINFDF